MTENVGKVDRIARTVASVSLLGAGFALLRGQRPRAAVASVIAGTALLETAITRVCSINYLLGIDSRSDAEALEDLRRAELFTRKHHPDVIQTHSLTSPTSSNREAPSSGQ